MELNLLTHAGLSDAVCIGTHAHNHTDIYTDRCQHQNWHIFNDENDVVKPIFAPEEQKKSAAVHEKCVSAVFLVLLRDYRCFVLPFYLFHQTISNKDYCFAKSVFISSNTQNL